LWEVFFGFLRNLILGGAAGCVVAGRLAKADPSLQVLVVEAGSDNRDAPDVVVPGFMANHFGGAKNTINTYTTTSTKSSLAPEYVVCGGILGGGSSVSYMMYTTGCASDFDDWKMDGWRFEDLKPLFSKVR
jgi:alcohol oxidase